MSCLLHQDFVFIYNDCYNNTYTSRCCLLKGEKRTIDDIIQNIDEILTTKTDLNFISEGHSHTCKHDCSFLKATKLVISLIRICNLRCYNCCAGFDDKTIRTSNIKNITENKKSLFKLLYGLKNKHLDDIILDGSGEIFFYYKDVEQWLSQLTINDFKMIEFTTNASLLNKAKIEDLKKRSESTGIKYRFVISIDGISKETFENTRRGASFEKVMENFNLLIKYFSNKNVNIIYTRKKTNASENLEDVQYFFNEKGVSVKFNFDYYDPEIFKNIDNKYKWDNLN